MPTQMDLGRLRTVRRLGAGGFATVWLAHDPALDSRVAVKVLADNWAQHADVRDRFLAEARLLRRVDSDGVVRVYDIGELEDGRPWFSMTYAAGGTLAERLPWSGSRAEAMRLLEDLAGAVELLHRHAIVHRDLSPGNILFVSTPSGERVVVGDLGLAKDLGFASGLTQPGGTGDYRAPEQLEYSAEVSPPTDVYALSVLAGHLLGEGLPARATALLERARSVRVADRHPSAGEFVADLAAALPSTGTTGAPTQERTDTAGPAVSPSRHRWLIPATVLSGVLLLVVVVALVQLLPERTSRVLTPDRSASVLLPGRWEAVGPAAVPGAGTDASGIEVARGEQRVMLAHSTTEVDDQQVAEDAEHEACRRDEPEEVTVSGWSGTQLTWTDCPDGLTRTEIGLGQQGAGTIYLAVTSEGSEPDPSVALASLLVPAEEGTP